MIVNGRRFQVRIFHDWLLGPGVGQLRAPEPTAAPQSPQPSLEDQEPSCALEARLTTLHVTQAERGRGGGRGSGLLSHSDRLSGCFPGLLCWGNRFFQ